MREKLAELCHSQWSGWMKYLFSKCTNKGAQVLIIPKWAVDRWTQQMNTPYSELSEEEKNSDRDEADRFLTLIKELNFISTNKQSTPLEKSCHTCKSRFKCIDPDKGGCVEWR